MNVIMSSLIMISLLTRIIRKARFSSLHTKLNYTHHCLCPFCYY
ncbi:hypothetical protein CXB51_019675 [Gossypium anomalum]|uniref:Uncharacterized protein n=1 Tax=Gossypium anomalum TaxID=47600 RepID=A0A8J6D026_9ROSI|nr:hypothetical protein CXB51_019675 [Gossypium anomalum]